MSGTRPDGSVAPAGAGAQRGPAALVRWPWWAQVLAVTVLARAVSAGILLLVARSQEANLWTGAAPSYLEYTGLMWDASWYREIAESGYPSELPRGADGRVQQNAWAFFPLFPALARLVMTTTGAPWHVVAPVLATVLGVGAMLVVHQVVTAGVGPEPSLRALPLATVAVLSTFAAAPVLLVGYTESLALLLLAAALWCVVRRHYVAALPVVLALGLTRAVALPVAVAVLAHAVGRAREARHGEPWPTRDKALTGVLGVVALASGLLWPAVCGAVTGEPDAYTLTQAAWRGRGEVVPLVPWLDVARWLFGPWGVLVLILVLVLAVVAVVTGPMRRLGPALQGWTAGYLTYLVAVLEPGTSLVRFLLLAFPLAAVLALLALRSRAPRAALASLIVLGVLAQLWWAWSLWRLVPPSGWPP